jgi:hypothetical protein
LARLPWPLLRLAVSRQRLGRVAGLLTQIQALTRVGLTGGDHGRPEAPGPAWDGWRLLDPAEGPGLAAEFKLERRQQLVSLDAGGLRSAPELGRDQAQVRDPPLAQDFEHGVPMAHAVLVRRGHAG